MRILAILFNLLLLGMVIYLFSTRAPASGDDWLLAILMILTPIFSLIAIFRSKGDNWLALYLKRKALEEKQKIDQISGKKD
jgi:hypothetical protein